MVTAKGHMHQKRHNLKSNKAQELKTPEEKPMKPLVQCKNTVFTDIINHNQKIATDITKHYQSHQIGETSIYLFYMTMIESTYSSAK